MQKTAKNTRGFTIVGSLLVVIVLVAIGFVGYDVWHKDHKNQPVPTIKTTASSQTKSPSSSAYAGWKTYTLPQEKLTFRYPSSWSLVNYSNSANDNVELSANNGFEMLIGAGPVVSAIDNYPSSCVAKADPVTFAGQTAYLDFIPVDDFGLNGCTPISSNVGIDEIILSTSSSQAEHDNFFATKHIDRSQVVVEADYEGPNFAKESNWQTINYIENDPNYQDAKLLVDSMNY